MKPEQVLPALRWARGYDRHLLTADGRAALVVGVLIVPQAMAYATLAGTPPITGLYAAVVALTVYALLGSSDFSCPAPAAIDALLVAAAVGPLADGDPGRYVALAGLLALLTGALQIAAGALRVGALVGFVSVPVISGFTMAAALTIAVSQLRPLLGLSGGGGTATLLDGVTGLLDSVGTIQWVTAAVGIGCVIGLLALRRFTPSWLPAPLVVLVVVTALVSLPGLRGQLAAIGPVPHGLPTPALPALSTADIAALLPSAAALALVSYLESIGSAAAFARRTRARINPNQELVALGACNTACGLFRGFNVAAGFSRSALSFNAGARTPLTGLLAAVLVAVALLTIGPVLALLPVAALAAVIMVSVFALVDLRATLEVARVRRTDLIALVAAFLATAVLGPASGLGVGVGVSLVVFLRQSARPHFPELGRVEGTARYRNLSRYSDVYTDRAVLLLRLDAPLYFANAQEVSDRVSSLAARRPELRHVVVDASAISWLDYTGTETIAELERSLGESGVQLHLAALRGPPRDILARTRHGAWMAEHHRLHPDVAAAVSALGLDPDSDLLPPAVTDQPPTRN